MDCNRIFENGPIVASAPCRIDMGGTLDLPALSLPLATERPVTFNLALDMRTTVSLHPFETGRIRVESKGFEAAEFESGRLPHDHPMGWAFILADSFGMDGIRIEIESTSPPRSALGGSSVAAMALVATLLAARKQLTGEDWQMDAAVLRAYGAECAAAGALCGLQDHLAAAYGGCHAWIWDAGRTPVPWLRESLIPEDGLSVLGDHILVAYAGNPHDSLDVNGRWVAGFRSGETRETWMAIAALSRQFCQLVEAGDFGAAGGIMKAECDLRRMLTPDVLDAVGTKLVTAAEEGGCGGRFCGAGGGGCIWAIGEKAEIDSLRKTWQDILSPHPTAHLLDTRPDPMGIRFD